LTDFRLSCLEGNHRLEFYSRIALGFDINQQAPLQFLDNPRQFPPESTVYRCIPAQIYFQSNVFVTEAYINKIQVQSFVIQKQKALQIKSTWQNILSTIAEKIMIITNGGEKEEYVIDPFTILTTKDSKLDDNLEKLSNIHQTLLDIVIDVCFEYDPAREELKEIDKIFNKQKMKNVVKKKTTFWKGITSHIYSFVSISECYSNSKLT